MHDYRLEDCGVARMSKDDDDDDEEGKKKKVSSEFCSFFFCKFVKWVWLHLLKTVSKLYLEVGIEKQFNTLSHCINPMHMCKHILLGHCLCALTGCMARMDGWLARN